MDKKNVLITVDSHFIRKGETYYCESLLDDLFWEKYLSVFDKVYAICRMKEYENEDLDKWKLVNTKNVVLLPVFDFRGPVQYAKNFYSFKSKINEYIKETKASCAIFRLPSSLGFEVARQWSKLDKPYATEIVVDLTDEIYYKQGFVKKQIYKYWNHLLKKYAKQADGTSYVTKYALQQKYPYTGFTTNYSSIDLPMKYFYKRDPLEQKKDYYTLIHTSTLTDDVKGHETFLRALKGVRDKGFDVRAVIIGGGGLKSHYEQRAAELGLSDYVRFTGHLSEKYQIRNELINADIFVFPTESEGLPRCMIEAMACSLPCISTPIAGIPELLDSFWMLDPHDVKGFEDRIVFLIKNYDKYNEASYRNYEVSLNYSYPVLMERRKDFYKKLLNAR